jgi:hypothetical protein
MSDVMDREMWRVIVVDNSVDRGRPVQDFFYFWNEEEADIFYNKTNEESFNDPELYRYAIRPVKVK